MAKFFALAMAVVVAVAVADFVAHPQGTAAVANGVSSVEKSALNAELGKTS